MAKKKSSEYWQNRFDQVEQAANNKSARYANKLEKKYKAAMKELDTKINSWYARLAKNNEITVSEARKLLSKSELAEFKWDVQQYIEYGKQNAIDQRWMKELENASAKFHINRLEALKLECRQQIEVALANGQQAMFDTLGDVYKESFYRSCFEIQKGFGVGFDVSRLDNGQVAKLLNKPWSVDGVNFSSKIWANKTKLINTLDQELSVMVMTGSDPRKAIRNVQKAMNTSLANAKRLVVTEQAYFTTLGQKDCFDELDVEEFEIVATLDSDTSEICQEMDGKHFPTNEMKPGVNAPPFHPYCFDKYTEVLTDNGWKLFADLKENDLVYTIDKDTLIPEWQKPINYISYKYDGNLLSFNNDRTDLVVTPNHNLLVQNMDYSVKDKSFKLRRADSIGRKSKNRMLSGCNWIGNKATTAFLGGKEIDIVLYLKFMAYWLADGSCTPDRGSYNIKIAQCDNDWMYEELKELPYTLYKCKEAIIIHDKALGEELRQYGKCTDKYIPSIIKGLTPELIKIFLIAYSKTDGTTKKGKTWKGYQFKDSIAFFSTSEQMASDLGELILKVGGRPSYQLNCVKDRKVQFKNGEYTINHDCWTIYWNIQIYSWICYMDVTEIPYNDYVYCVEVEKHNTLLVRRNGKVIWSGNCRSTTCPYFNDEFSALDKRVAKGEDGKWYEIDASMTYPEWKKSFVDGGSKADLTPITSEEPLENTRKSVTMKVEQTKAYTKIKVEDIPSMDEAKFNKVKAGLEKNGIVVIQDADGDAYLKHMNAEAMTLSDGSAVIFQSGRIPSASAVFEEIIHTTQIKNNGMIESTGDIKAYVEYLNREIEANEKLLKYKKAYGLTREDVESIEENLAKYYEDLKGVK